MAFTAMGIYKDVYEAVDRMVRIKDEFLPDPIERETYKYIFNEIFSKIFGKLLPIYKKEPDCKELLQ